MVADSSPSSFPVCEGVRDVFPGRYKSLHESSHRLENFILNKAGMYLWQTEGTASVLVQTQTRQSSLGPPYSSHGNSVDVA